MNLCIMLEFYYLCIKLKFTIKTNLTQNSNFSSKNKKIWEQKS
jgi:hypothetical protein